MIDPGEKLLRELEEAEVHLKLIQDYRKGADYDFNQVRDSINSLKERLSQIRIWSPVWTKNVSGTEMGFPLGDLPKTLDAALALMEAFPQNARFLLQYALLQGQTKIEDTLAIISTLMDVVHRVQSSRRR